MKCAFMLAILLVPLVVTHAADAPKQKPNILVILCDDLGYGDVKCLGGELSKIATPNIDRLASQAMVLLSMVRLRSGKDSGNWSVVPVPVAGAKAASPMLPGSFTT